MNKEEILNKYIDLIDKGYCSDCNELNCIDNFFYAKITHAIRELQQENQELKKQLHEASLTIQEMTEQDIECPSNCEKLKILKEQLEEYKKLGFKYLQDKSNNLETQQKEFINYLEDKIDICDGFLDTVKSDLRNTPYRVMLSKKTNITNRIKENEIAHKVYKEILQKYKEIAGVSDDKK